MPPNSPPRRVLDSTQISQALQKLAIAILKRHPDPHDLGLIGVHGGGHKPVHRVESAMANLLGGNGFELDKGLVDISFYRDDWTRLSQVPQVRSTVIPFDVQDRTLVLVDDVIFTGRTARAAMDAIFSLGRPARLELAALVDRGHREFPIWPDYVGVHLDTHRHESVNVYLFDDPEQDYATVESHKYHTLKAPYPQ